MKRALLLFALFACGDVRLPVSTTAPFNRCKVSSDCNAYAQQGTVCSDDGACLVPAGFSGTLVISLAQNSFYAPGQTLVLPAKYINELDKQLKIPSGCTTQDTRPACKCSASKKNCLFLPANGGVDGALVVPRGVAADIWPSTVCATLPQAQKDKLCGLRPSGDTTLPTHVMIRPLWSDDGMNFVDAFSLALPAPDIEARTLPNPGPIRGPNNTEATKFSAPLQRSNDALGISKYFMRIDPVSPFDSAFPPILLTPTAVAGADFLTQPMAALDPTATFDITSAGPNMEGWKVFLATHTTVGPSGAPWRKGERVSSIATLGVAGGKAELQTDFPDSFGAPRASFEGLKLVVQPPEGSALPTYTSEELGGAIPSDHVFPPCPNTMMCPKLPPPAMTSGQVTFAGLGHRARIWFVSQTGDKQGIQLDDMSFRSALSYETMIETANDGSYSALLPPGTYDAFVEPIGKDAAKTTLSYAVALGQPVQGGKSLALAPLAHVRGTVVVGDGRPLGDANVVFAPAADQAKGTNAHAKPRTFTTTTALSGMVASFDIDVDPGQYDVTIQPVDGTRLPWIVSTTRDIKPSAVNNTGPAMLDPLTVPAPLRLSRSLFDPFGNPISSALVRAYSTSSLAAMASAPFFYEVGRASTDSAGHFDLYLGPQPK